jgi:ATP-binding cassette subfamily B protein RaxB
MDARTPLHHLWDLEAMTAQRTVKINAANIPQEVEINEKKQPEITATMRAKKYLGALTGSLNLGWRTRLPMVLQSEAAECGLACLAMVLAWHGQPLELAELRRRFGMSLRGATLKDLGRISGALSLEARPLRLDLEELSHLSTPCILHWDLNHFVVLKEVGRKDITIHDPAFGVRRLSVAEVSKHFTGIAMELTPAAGMEQLKPAPRIKMRALLGRMVGLKASLARVFSLALALEVALALSPMFMQWVIDDALVAGDRDLLTTLALGFMLLLIVRTVFTALRGWMLLAIGATVKVQGRANLFSHLLQLPSSFFESRHLGDVLSRFGSQETILQAITTDIVEAVLDGLLAIFTLVLMFVFAPALAMVVLAGTLAYAALRWGSYTPLRNASAEQISWAAQRDTHFLETLRGMQAIKVFNAQDERRRRWLNLLVETVNRQLTTQKLQVVFTTGNLLVTGVIALVVVWLGARRVLDRTFTVGALIAFIAYKDQFMMRVTALINKALDLQMLRIHGERLADIALTKPEEKSPAMKADPHRIEIVGERKSRSIEVKNVKFRYSEHDPWVLDGIDLKIEAGESVAIVGGSGCGKTTLLKVIASLLSPNEGTVCVDDQAITKVGVDRYRDMLGVVMQDDQLFAGSIADNICFFSESPDQRRIEECAKAAAVHDVIAVMPMGYATLIGDMGAALSGGQKQRILIARALYRQPGILLLDEATSHLDVSRERAVNKAIQEASVTRIIVAHRPETILSADRVIVMANGRIVDTAVKGDFQLSLLGLSEGAANPLLPRRNESAPPTPPPATSPSPSPAPPFRKEMKTQRIGAFDPGSQATQRLGSFKTDLREDVPRAILHAAKMTRGVGTQKIAAYRRPVPSVVEGKAYSLKPIRKQLPSEPADG